MSMTRPDFEALAEMCADETHKDLLCDATIDLLVAFCKSRNPNFDSDKFHNKIAKLKLAQRMAMKGVNKEWFDKHVEVIL